MSNALGNVTLRQLRSLAAISTSGSVTGAAKLLGLTQPAVTLQIRGLQDLVGLPLLQRTDDGMALTEAGAEVLALHQRITVSMADCTSSLDAIKGLSGGRVAVGAVSTAKYFVPFAIAEFARRFPKIQIKLSIGNREEILAALRSYALDVAITGRPPEDMELEKRSLGAHPHVIIAPPDHALARHDALRLADLTDQTFIVREPELGTRLLMQRTFADAAFEPKIGMEIDSNETIKQAVMAGLGISFISGHTVASECHDGRLCTLDVQGLPLMRQWFVVRRSDKQLLPPAQAMLDFLGAEGPKFLPAGM